MGEGARKGALKIACSTLSWLEYRIQRDHHSCGRNNYNLNVATWNVRTLLDNCEQSNRPERRTALVSLELKRFKIDIAALQETRRAGTGQLTEHGGGYTFYWQGRPEGQPRMHGVGFAIRNDLIHHLASLPHGVNERIMKLRLSLDRNQYATVICAYAPTLDADDEVKEVFYSELDEILTSTHRHDKIILLGDFNARVGRDQELWKGVIGKEGVGNCNSNGIHLLTLCSEHQLVITNTMFRQRNKFKTTWQHPRSKHWHLIDYAIVRSRDLKDVRITKSITSADDCWTDHRLVRTVFAIQLHRRRCHISKQTKRRLDVAKLEDPTLREEFNSTLTQSLSSVHGDNVEEYWGELKAAILSASEATIGFRTKKHQDWFDENDHIIEAMISEKRKAFCTWQSDPTNEAKRNTYHSIRATVQRRIRLMKDQWWAAKAEQLQDLANRGDSRGFFNATRTIFGPSTRGETPIKDKEGTLLKDSESINLRWKEHFQDLLNRDSHVDESVFELIPQSPINDVLGIEPSLAETVLSIRQMKNGKAPGVDGIPAEVLKHGGDELASRLHHLILLIWQTEEITSDLQDVDIVKIFKKGDKSECGNYRGISLLATVGKIIARILANRLVPHAEGFLPESQCGFRPNRGTTDMIFTARQLQEKCREQRQPLYMAFIDLTKAFDSVNRAALWRILGKFGCPEKFISIVRLLHDGMSARVLSSQAAGDPFEVHTGVKQGCVIAPTLFSIFISTIFHLIKDRLPEGIEIIYRTDGGLFNLRRLKARTKTRATSLIELQYADDNCVCATSESQLQCILDAFAYAYESLGLSINVRKTEVLYQPVPGQSPIPPSLNVSGSTLKNVPSFPYLGSVLSVKADIDAEIVNRLRAASSAFGKLRDRVFESRGLSKDTKILVYKAVVLPSLLYGSECWTTYRRHLKCLEKYHQRCLRRILGVTWQDYRTNSSILDEAHCTSIEAMVIRNQLRWTGHIIRLDESRLPQHILYGELGTGTRSQGGQRKRFKDNLKSSLKSCGINLSSWEALSCNRSRWRSAVTEGIETFERERRRKHEEKRLRRKRQRDTSTAESVTSASSVSCHHCGRPCASRIGLVSHLRVHK